MKVCIITGTRAEFGIWRPVLRALEGSKTLQTQLLVTGMHLLPAFGNTQRQIAAEGFKIAARVPMYRGREAAHASLARGIEGMGRALTRLKPDLVMVLGDRLEMLAAASAALAARIPIAHVHGGESAQGIWDEQIRHAITKMAHVHFCATAVARNRIIQMGEPPSSVHQVGAPALDLAREHYQLCCPIAAKIRRYRRDGKRGPEAVVVLHPEGGSDADEKRKAAMLIGALRDANIPFDAIGPNNDPGHQGILDAYAEAGVRVQMNVPQDRFWTLLAYASFLIGNSSSGIIESATFGVLAINLGSRQQGRERNGNVIDVGWQPRAIAAAIKKSLHDRNFLRQLLRRKNLYGDGRAAQRIVKILERVAGKSQPVEKQFCDAGSCHISGTL